MTTSTNSKKPFNFETYVDLLLRAESPEKIAEDFARQKSKIEKVIGNGITQELSQSTLLQSILLQALKEGTLKTCYIVYLASKNKSYQNAATEEKPLVFLYKILPIWFKEELGKKYLSERDQIRLKLNLSLKEFLQLEGLEAFRDAVTYTTTPKKLIKKINQQAKATDKFDPALMLCSLA